MTRTGWRQPSVGLRYVICDPRSCLEITVLPGDIGLRLAGEADLSNAADLRVAINQITRNATEVHLQLSELKFIDVTATRELVRMVILPPLPQVILHHPPQMLTKMITLLWPEIADRFLVGQTRTP
jgi:hypothetical protein